MKLKIFLAWVLSASALSGWATDAPLVHHVLKVALDPATHTIEVQDRITLPATHSTHGQTVEFALHSSLTATAVDATIETLLLPTSGAAASNGDMSALVKRYRAVLPAGQRILTLKYQGKIYHPLNAEGDDYSRSFHETPGLIAEEGIFLAGSTLWYPTFSGARVSFELHASVPAGWLAVSQGKRTQHTAAPNTDTSVWEEHTPQEEIYLVANRFTEYSQAAGAVQAMVFLRQADPALAQKYLDATAQYLEMYRALIGPYPYTKFALVENFWETGYGMPSFTLLGSKVIRLPFILTSSYPHEILHNWWGNGVYVDYATGNWAEGLTSYLADHLLKEQQNEGAGYRRSALQNYADFVSNSKDFPLTEFRARHSASSEAIGYGKTQMLFHMLRRMLGDAVFVKALHQFYAKFKFKVARFADVEAAFSSASGKDLHGFFAQWVERTGAPQLRIRDVVVTQKGSGFELRGVLEQIQVGALYTLNVPLAVTVDGQEAAVEQEIALSGKQAKIQLSLPTRPLRVDVDPQFDLFRRLGRAEIPPALSQVFGAEKTLLVLPAAADATLLSAYHQLAEVWQRTQASSIEIVLDRDIKELPADRAVWLVGWENTFVPSLLAALRDYPVQASDTGITVAGNVFRKAQDAVVLTARHPSQPQHALAWLATENIKAVAGLANKLPHYRKYSYLAFSGDEPTNTSKGQWPVIGSPMTVVVGGDNATVTAAKLAPRTALAQVPSLFSAARMLTDVHALASPDKEGRGLGTRGLDAAAEYIAAQFRTAGLQPGFEGEPGYMQRWTEFVPELQRDVALKNVIGILPGRNPAFAGQSVVISAHYDHLGMGGPGARAEHRGKLHPGADDNASGVAVMLELARLAAQKWLPERTLVFVAFSGEEQQRLGSIHYVRNYSRFPATQALAVLNLDTVGRLGDAALTVFGTGSAQEWVHIFRGAQFVTGVNVKPVASEIGSSDQRSFLDIGVPGVQLFGTVHTDFHSPRDRAEEVDGAGMIKVAMVLKEAVEYLSARPEPLTSLATRSAPATASGPSPSARQVSLGTVPDYAYSGPGVRLSDVLPGSPAAAAGLRADDVLIRMEDKVIADLAGLAQILRTFKVGQKITAVYQRAGQEFGVQIEMAAR